MKSLNDLENYRYRARVTFQGRDEFTETWIVLNSDVLTTADNKSLHIRDISRINVLLWEKRDAFKGHTFYPSRYEIIFADYRKVTVNGNIDSLNRIKTGNRRPGYLYFYYYDYYKKGRWVNSGVPEYNALISKPAAGCAVSIELIQ